MLKQRGFTIIELIVVIAIIAVLAAIIITNVGSYVVKAKVARFQAEANQMSLAMTQFYMQYGKYPTDQDYPFSPPTGDSLPQDSTNQPFVEQGALHTYRALAVYPSWDATYWGNDPQGAPYSYFFDDWCDGSPNSCDGSCAFLACLSNPNYNSCDGFEYNISCSSCPQFCGSQQSL